MKINIYFNASGYPIDRMIKNKTSNNYRRISKAWDIKLVFLYIVAKIFPWINKDNYYNRLMFTYRPWRSFNGVLHVFNTIYIGDMNWCTTIEYMFPAAYYKMSKKQYSIYIQKMAKYIVCDNCKKLLPLSEYSKRRIINDLNEFLPLTSVETIKRKILVLHPPQDELISEEKIKDKFDNINELRICFVGRDFWRKGGYIALKALKKLNKKYSNFKFIIVSSLRNDGGWYVNDKEMLEQEIKECDFVEWYKELENEKVIEIIRKSHIGLLLTYGDTYGFSVLEMQACGCPCITTNGFALSEINNINCGWIIEQSNINDGISLEEKLNLQDKLIDKLADLIEMEILTKDDYKEVLQTKAINSLQRIRDKHNPVKYKEVMEKIYNEALI